MINFILLYIKKLKFNIQNDDPLQMIDHMISHMITENLISGLFFKDFLRLVSLDAFPEMSAQKMDALLIVVNKIIKLDIPGEVHLV